MDHITVDKILEFRTYCGHFIIFIEILTAPPPENWNRPPGHPCIMWLNTIQQDLRAYNLTLNEAVNLAQNRPLCRLMSTYGAMHF